MLDLRSGLSLHTLGALSAELSQLAQAADPLVVAVHGRRRWPSTGSVWGDGLIATAAHAIRRRGEIPLSLASGDEARAELLGIDSATDLAVLKTMGAAATSFEYAESPPIEIASLGLVVSRRAGGEIAATLAAVRSRWHASGLTSTPGEAFALSLAGYPGLSGSPFLTPEGRIGGLVIAGGWRAGAVLIPASTVTRVVREIAEKGRVSAPFLGIGIQPARLPERLREPLGLARPEGILVVGTQPDGPADAAGWLVGDVLVELAGHPTGNLHELRAALALAAVGTAVPARIVRGGEMKTLPIRVGERPGRRC